MSEESGGPVTTVGSAAAATPVDARSATVLASAARRPAFLCICSLSRSPRDPLEHAQSNGPRLAVLACGNESTPIRQSRWGLGVFAPVWPIRLKLARRAPTTPPMVRPLVLAAAFALLACAP